LYKDFEVLLVYNYLFAIVYSGFLDSEGVLSFLEFMAYLLIQSISNMEKMERSIIGND